MDITGLVKTKRALVGISIIPIFLLLLHLWSRTNNAQYTTIISILVILSVIITICLWIIRFQLLTSIEFESYLREKGLHLLESKKPNDDDYSIFSLIDKNPIRFGDGQKEFFYSIINNNLVKEDEGPLESTCVIICLAFIDNPKPFALLLPNNYMEPPYFDDISPIKLESLEFEKFFKVFSNSNKDVYQSINPILINILLDSKTKLGVEINNKYTAVFVVNNRISRLDMEELWQLTDKIKDNLDRT